MKKTKRTGKIWKTVICILLVAAFAGGGYYIGYKHQTSSIISAIPKQSHGKPSDLPEGTPLAEATSKPQEAVPKKDNEAPKATAENVKYIGKSEKSAIESSWTELDKYECDIDGDGTNDTIILATSAKKVDGEILWDDSQQWAVEVKSASGVYDLCNRKVSNGNVYFNVDEISKGTYAITVYMVSSSATTIKQYTYSKNGYVEKEIYADQSGNNLHSGIPAYE